MWAAQGLPATRPSRRRHRHAGEAVVLGATQFAEWFGQGFYGWIGDVRIVAQALRPTEFLTS